MGAGSEWRACASVRECPPADPCTHVSRPAKVCPRDWAPVGDKLQLFVLDPQLRPKLSSTAAISHQKGVLQLAVHEVPLSQKGYDWLAFCISLAQDISAYIPATGWHGQPNDCIILCDNATVHTHWHRALLTGEFLSMAPLRLAPLVVTSGARAGRPRLTLRVGFLPGVRMVLAFSVAWALPSPVSVPRLPIHNRRCSLPLSLLAR